ncbi:unnamed protein product, partial [marine sediment metagenome]
YYNLRTKNRRAILARTFEKLAPLWGGEGSIEVGEITEQEFIPAGMNSPDNFTETQLKSNEEREEAAPEEETAAQLKLIYN